MVKLSITFTLTFLGVDLGDAVANELALPFQRISLETIDNSSILNESYGRC